MYKAILSMVDVKYQKENEDHLLQNSQKERSPHANTLSLKLNVKR